MLIPSEKQSQKNNAFLVSAYINHVVQQITCSKTFVRKHLFENICSKTFVGKHLLENICWKTFVGKSIFFINWTLWFLWNLFLVSQRQCSFNPPLSSTIERIGKYYLLYCKASIVVSIWLFWFTIYLFMLPLHRVIKSKRLNNFIPLIIYSE